LFEEYVRYDLERMIGGAGSVSGCSIATEESDDSGGVQHWQRWYNGRVVLIFVVDVKVVL
jgi:hypothetical protein